MIDGIGFGDRLVIAAELTDRCRSNPNYSLRSFARSLKVEPSALSQIINGKRPLTQKMKFRLGTALGLSVDKIKNYPATEDELSDDSTHNYEQLTLDTFAVISDWYHYAILELTYVEGFESNTSWISKRLGITKSEANIAVERLIRLGLMQISPRNIWVDASSGGKLTHLKPNISSEAARKYQCQLLDLSQRAVQEVDVKKRNHTSATLCFDPERLPDAIKKIAKFRRAFAKEFQPKNAKEVYQIQISLFPLTKNIGEPK